MTTRVLNSAATQTVLENHRTGKYADAEYFTACSWRLRFGYLGHSEPVAVLRNLSYDESHKLMYAWVESQPE